MSQPLPLALGLPALGILLGAMLISAGRSGNYDQYIYCWWIPGSADDKRRGSRFLAKIVGLTFVILSSVAFICNFIELFRSR